MARARTLSFALAAIGLLAVATPASATHRDVFKTRLELTRVVQTEAGNYRVKGRIHSPDERCRKRGVFLRRTAGVRHTDWADATTRRGKFSIRVPQSEEGSTFRVIYNSGPEGEHGHRFDPPFTCKGAHARGDKSRRFTLPPSS